MVKTKKASKPCPLSDSDTHYKTNPKQRIKYPFRVDYNDHFETPRIAYEHILPLLDAVSPFKNNNSNKEETPVKKKKKRRRKSGDPIENGGKEPCIQCTRKEHIIYDPYYCNGKMKETFHQFGFTNIQHEKRDFYKDIKNKTVPYFNTLVTNPPYSGNHKEKCMQFAIEHLRKSQNQEGDSDVPNNHKKGDALNDEDQVWKNEHKPFFILMPNYVACRNHFRTSIMTATSEGDPLDIFYIVPSIPYEYEHPEGTGKEIPPFSSIWYCGIPRYKVDDVKSAFRIAYGNESVGVTTGDTGKGQKSSSPRLLSSLAELKQLNAIPTQKRPNPKQRKKAKLAKLKGATTNTIALKPNSKKVEKQGNKKRKRY